MGRPRNADREEILHNTRSQLLQAAAAEFAREGYVGANINRISLTAGFAKGTVYNHFSSKRDLMLALIDYIAGEHTAAILQQIKPEQIPSQRLVQFFRAGFAYVEAHPIEARSIINVVYGPDPEFQERVYHSYEPLFSTVIDDILGAGVTTGEYRPLDLDLTTALIMTMYLGSCSQVDAGGKIWLDPDRVAEFILDGIRPRSESSG